ncbi:MAG: hypothetical protein OXB91_07375 [Bryobacterales bacterium]|nr:hypothetical protein [Bryobacterales bacterium]
MAHRIFPNRLRDRVQVSTYAPLDPAEVLQTAAQTTQVIRRGFGRWQGVLTFGLMEIGEGEDIRDIEAWLAGLEGRINTFDAPIGIPNVGDIAGLDAGDMNTPPQALQLGGDITLSGGLAVIPVSGADAGLLRGHVISVGGQLYKLQSDLGSGTCTALPARVVGASGDPVEWLRPVQKARVGTRGVGYGRRSGGLVGPWTIPWVSEAV